MGASLQGKSGRSSGGYRRRRSSSTMSDINVTPFVDVMLVLLIVFMVTAPLLTAGVKVDLPSSQANPINNRDNKPLEISLTKDSLIFIGETEVKRERLVTLLSSMTNNDSDRRIFIRADQALDYGYVMDILGALNKAGFNKVALLSNAS
ncbi:MAG: protein TolR [Alphaproteobacteria bacterium]|jgi:biopolymer transport protein TolR|nr:protein TolR [Alphaproteobacteria bacterium]MDP7222624.1 protein TolR [Alphaproteobacteria bacterium]